MGIILNDQQDECVKKAIKWYKRLDSKQTFEVSGPAGSGKTTMVKALIHELGIDMDDVLFVAYVGKAALQLTRSGVNGRTIHSTFYDIIHKPVLDDDNKPIIRNGRLVTKPEFIKKSDLPRNIKLIVLDEGPMVNENFGKDIESFGIPVLVLGDLQQLPPVIGQTHYLIRPDYILTKVMRQREGDPIIYLSQLAARGEKIPYGKYGPKCFVIPKKMVTDQMMKDADMILTPTNSNRAAINKYVREQIYHIDSELPMPGEKLICRKNNWSRILGDNVCLVNGMIGYVEEARKSTFNGKTIDIDFQPDFCNEVFRNVKIDYKSLMRSVQQVNGKYEKGFSMYDMFEFGYGMTVHLSQGSQSPNVLFLGDRFGSREMQCKIDYTGITRASEGLIFAY